MFVPNSSSVLLDIALSAHLDISLIQIDIQATYIRVLVKGRLLQLRLPCQVARCLKETKSAGIIQVLSDLCKAERSLTTGNLLITMPKASPGEAPNLLYMRSREKKEGLCGDDPLTSAAPYRPVKKTLRAAVNVGVLGCELKHARYLKARGKARLCQSLNPGEWHLKEVKHAAMEVINDTEEHDDSVPELQAF